MNTQNKDDNTRRPRPLTLSGLGGVPIGNGFEALSDEDSFLTLEAAWEAGIRYFDTSPWYGLGISEHRMGMFLKNKKKEEYTISTKIGRILSPHDDFKKEGLMWKGKMNFSYSYDFSAEGARRSVEDSLQRLGIGSLDFVFIHDLSSDNADLGEGWVKYFEIASKGAMPELTKMREQGLIKGWGLGVNTVEPILKTLEIADPDIFLSACQYSLIQHETDLNVVFPKVEQRGISIVVGAPLCAGFLSGKDRYLYSNEIPNFASNKLLKLQRVAQNHHVDLRTAALQFAAAPTVVSSIIPGASSATQVTQNVNSLAVDIPLTFWDELKNEKLISENAPVPIES